MPSTHPAHRALAWDLYRHGFFPMPHSRFNNEVRPRKPPKKKMRKKTADAQKRARARRASPPG